MRPGVYGAASLARAEKLSDPENIWLPVAFHRCGLRKACIRIPAIIVTTARPLRRGRAVNLWSALYCATKGKNAPPARPSKPATPIVVMSNPLVFVGKVATIEATNDSA
jgi:hypothetical protein